MIEPCGQLEAVGRPTLYRTTDLFLRTMGIESLEGLPPLPEISGSDGLLQLQQKVDALRAAEQTDDEMMAEQPEAVHTQE